MKEQRLICTYYMTFLFEEYKLDKKKNCLKTYSFFLNIYMVNISLCTFSIYKNLVTITIKEAKSCDSLLVEYKVFFFY